VESLGCRTFRICVSGAFCCYCIERSCRRHDFGYVPVTRKFCYSAEVRTFPLKAGREHCRRSRALQPRNTRFSTACNDRFIVQHVGYNKTLFGASKPLCSVPGVESPSVYSAFELLLFWRVGILGAKRHDSLARPRLLCFLPWRSHGTACLE
jgi:hypothetical protein